VIKRSQTFSPSAAVSKNHYICRVSFDQILLFVRYKDNTRSHQRNETNNQKCENCYLIFIAKFQDIYFLSYSSKFISYLSFLFILRSLIAAIAIAVCHFIAEVDLFNGIQWRDVLFDGVDRLPLSVAKPLRRNRLICHLQRGHHWISN
jgi:hypothetical protein